MDHADKKHDADYYIGSQLYALTNIPIYSSPNGTLKTTRTKGTFVGTIYSWIRRDGYVWWQLTDGGFVKHAPGIFDVQIAGQTASGKAHEEKMQTLGKDDAVTETVSNIGSGIANLGSGLGDALAGVGDALSGLGKNILWILLLIIIAWILINSKQK